MGLPDHVIRDTRQIITWTNADAKYPRVLVLKDPNAPCALANDARVSYLTRGKIGENVSCPAPDPWLLVMSDPEMTVEDVALTKEQTFSKYKALALKAKKYRLITAIRKSFFLWLKQSSKANRSLEEMSVYWYTRQLQRQMPNSKEVYNSCDLALLQLEPKISLTIQSFTRRTTKWSPHGLYWHSKSNCCTPLLPHPYA
eukprot:IDg6756t1